VFIARLSAKASELLGTFVTYEPSRPTFEKAEIGRGTNSTALLDESRLTIDGR